MNVAVAPVPVCVNPPGVAVICHAPVAGNPLNETLPVGVKHDGCVIEPTIGELGWVGIALIAIDAEFEEVQVDEFVTDTVNVVPAVKPVHV